MRKVRVNRKAMERLTQAHLKASSAKDISDGTYKSWLRVPHIRVLRNGERRKVNPISLTEIDYQNIRTKDQFNHGALKIELEKVLKKVKEMHAAEPFPENSFILFNDVEKKNAPVEVKNFFILEHGKFRPIQKGDPISKEYQDEVEDHHYYEPEEELPEVVRDAIDRHNADLHNELAEINISREPTRRVTLSDGAMKRTETFSAPADYLFAVLDGKIVPIIEQKEALP